MWAGEAAPRSVNGAAAAIVCIATIAACVGDVIGALTLVQHERGQSQSSHGAAGLSTGGVGAVDSVAAANAQQRLDGSVSVVVARSGLSEQQQVCSGSQV